MILSLLFSVSLGRLITASQPRLGLTLSGNSPLPSSSDHPAYTSSVCPCPMVSLQCPCQCSTSMSASFAKSTLWKESTFSSIAGVSLFYKYLTSLIILTLRRSWKSRFDSQRMGTQNGFRIAPPISTNGSRRIERPQPIST
jgi:hypothetical protein